MSESTLRAFSCAQAVLEHLGRSPAHEGERRDLAAVIDRAAGLPELIQTNARVVELLDQVEKHLDPFPGQEIKIWKRALIDEMKTHLRGAKRLLQESVAEEG